MHSRGSIRATAAAFAAAFSCVAADNCAGGVSWVAAYTHEEGLVAPAGECAPDGSVALVGRKSPKQKSLSLRSREWLPYEAGKDYEVSGWIKTEGREHVHLGVDCFRDGAKHHYRRFECETDGAWRHFSFAFSAPSVHEFPVMTNGTTRLMLMLRGPGAEKGIRFAGVALRNVRLPRGASMRRQGANAEKPPLPPNPVSMPSTCGNRLFNASFEMDAPCGHAVLTETDYADRRGRARAVVDGSTAVHGARSLRIDAAEVPSASIVRYASSAAHFETAGAKRTRIVFSCWLKSDREEKAQLRLEGAVNDWDRQTTAWWGGASADAALGRAWRRFSVSAELPSDVPFVAPRIYFSGPGTRWIDAVQCEREKMTDFAPAAAAESAFLLREHVFVQAPGETSVRTAELHRVEYPQGGVRATVGCKTFRTGRYGVFDLSDGAGERPTLPERYAVVHPLDAPPEDGFVSGVGGECCPLKVTWKNAVWAGDPDFAPRDWFKTLRLSGARVWRTHDGYILWRDLNPEKGVYDWTSLDTAVEDAESAGMTLMFVLGSGALVESQKTASASNWFVRLNSKYGRKTPWGSNTFVPAEGDWTEFIGALAARYKGRIRYYEVVNEPNLTMPDPETYARYMRLAYETIKRIDASATVVGVCTTEDFVGSNDRFARAVAEAGGLRHLDALSFHPYNSPDDVAEFKAGNLISDLRAIMEGARCVRPLMNTEIYYLAHDINLRNANAMFDFPAWMLTRRLAIDAGEGLAASTPLAVPQYIAPSPAMDGLFCDLYYAHRFRASELFVAGNAFSFFLEGAFPLPKPCWPEGVNGYAFRDRRGGEVRTAWATALDLPVAFEIPEGFEAYDHFGNLLPGRTAALSRAPVFLRREARRHERQSR